MRYPCLLRRLGPRNTPGPLYSKYPTPREFPEHEILAHFSRKLGLSGKRNGNAYPVLTTVGTLEMQPAEIRGGGGAHVAPVVAALEIPQAGFDELKKSILNLGTEDEKIR